MIAMNAYNAFATAAPSPLTNPDKSPLLRLRRMQRTRTGQSGIEAKIPIKMLLESNIKIDCIIVRFSLIIFQVTRKDSIKAEIYKISFLSQPFKFTIFTHQKIEIKMLIDLNKRYWQWILLIFLAFIWGTSFILMKKGLVSFTNLQVGAMRIFFSFIFFIPLIFLNLRKVNRHNIRSLLIVGIVGNGIPAVLFATAQTEINSSLAGILNSLTPLFTLLIGIIIYRNKVKWLSIAGLILGMTGATGLILSVNNLEVGDTNKWYGMFAVIATVCYGINVNEIKFSLKDLDGVAIASLGFLFIGPVAGIFLLFSDYTMAIGSVLMPESLLAVAGLAFFSSFIAMIVMNILIKFTTTLFAASVTYIIPIFAVFWGMVDGEKFLLVHAFWALVIFAGVYLVNRKKTSYNYSKQTIIDRQEQLKALKGTREQNIAKH